MTLDLFRTRGRAARPVEAAKVRDLAPDDLVLLGAEKGSKAPALKRLGERHHALARALASGMAQGEAAVVCRYDSSRVSILLADPAFQELLAFYREDVNRQYLGLHEQLAGLAGDAAEELADRLAEEPEKFSIGQLMEVTKMGADRTGHGPQSSSTNVNVNVDLAARLQEARKRVQQRTISGD